MRTIHCEVFTSDGKKIVAVKRELPVGMTEEEAARWIYERAGELLPVVKQKRPHRD